MYQTFSDYQLVTQLTRKTASCVYLAQSMKEPSDDNVVLKVFDTISLDLAQEQKNFLQEVNFLKQLHHPYILPILSGGIEEGHPFLVSRYVPLGSLRSCMNSSSPVHTSLNEAIQTIVRVGQALSYAHTWDRLHANIKPENVLFDAGGKALLADFALNSIMTGNAAIQEPDPWSACYIAPEQLAGNISTGSDQYALGCIAYELLSGHPPFIWLSLEAIPHPLSQFVPDLPEHIEAAIFKAMAKNPFERHASIMAFIEALTERPLKVTAFPLTEGATELSLKAAVTRTVKTAYATEPDQIPDATLVSQSPLTPLATAALSPEMVGAASVAIPQSNGPEFVMTSSVGEQTEPPVVAYMPEESWQVSPGEAEIAQLPDEMRSRIPSHRKRKAVKGIWVALSLACLFALAVGLIPMLFLPSYKLMQADKSGTTLPTVQGDAATATIVQRTSSIPGASTATPTTQPTPMQAAQAAKLTATTVQSTPSVNVTLVSTPAPTPTVTKPTATPTAAAMPTPTSGTKPTPTPGAKPTTTQGAKPTPKPTAPCSCILLVCC